MLDLKVLVVDDMAVMRKIVKKNLEKVGFTKIEDAPDGIPAWEQLVAAHNGGDPFGFIVSDWNMPGMTGIDLLRRVRKDERFHKLPFLMVTAEGEKEKIVEAVKAGVSNFVMKPFDEVTFKGKIDLVFKKKG